MEYGDLKGSAESRSLAIPIKGKRVKEKLFFQFKPHFKTFEHKKNETTI